MLLLLARTSAFATAQIPDHIMYQGETYSLFAEPLDSYLNRLTPGHHELFPSVCTACWRGYVASWEVRENFLYLSKIVEGTCSPDAHEIPLENIFPGQAAPVRANWYSGVLQIPQGKRLRYERRGYGAVYERVLLLTVKDGKIISEMTMDNTK